MFLPLSLDKRIEWSTRSKALLKSINREWMAFFPSVLLSESFNHVCVMFTRADTVERPWKTACWFSLTLKASLFSIICTFPRTLARTEKTDICLKSVSRSSSNCVLLQIMFCSYVNETTLFSFLPISTPVSENGRSLRFPNIFIKKQTWWSNDKTVCYWTPLSQNIVICQCLTDQLFASAE